MLLDVDGDLEWLLGGDLKIFEVSDGTCFVCFKGKDGEGVRSTKFPEA